MIFLLSTQTLPDALIAAATVSRVQLDAMAFIRTERVEETGMLPEGPLTVVFTSQQAVGRWKGEGWRIFCTGGATRKLVSERFGEDAIAGTADSAEDLARVIIDSGAGKEVLFFCGDQRREELPVLLRQAGFLVHEKVVYRTVLQPQKIARRYDGIAFFSPSAVESFFSVNAGDAATVFFAIGRTTAAAIRARTGREAMVSSRPDKEVLIQQMIAHFKV